MGVVYKAEDLKLKRDVALKFLPAHLLGDDDIRARFEREAQAAASLHHPNICPVHEIDEADEKTFIAMAFIEGESLDKRIARGPLKLEEALSIARQIAEGLEAAHEKGIHHRDIKPENVIVDARGRATIMDFGLAQLTEASRLTRKDETVGTVFYMSPEQTDGSGTDNRTDIWSLGIVLYEMISGEKPFKGDYDKAVMYSILNEEPEPITAVRAGVPMELEVLVAKCLRKDPTQRYQLSTDLSVDLQAVQEHLGSDRRTTVHSSIARPAGKPPTTRRPAETGNQVDRSKFRAAVALAVVATAVATALAWSAFTSDATPTSTFQFQVPLVQEGVRPAAGTVGEPVISPDGQTLALLGIDQNGESSIYLRSLDQLDWRRLQGTERARFPFWSPDSQFLAFFADATLKKISVNGGPAFKICPVLDPTGGDWADPKGGSDGVIVFAERWQIGLQKVPASGGKPVVVVEYPSQRAPRSVRFLPDGVHFMYRMFVYGSQPDGATTPYSWPVSTIRRPRTAVQQRQRSC